MTAPSLNDDDGTLPNVMGAGSYVVTFKHDTGDADAVLLFPYTFLINLLEALLAMRTWLAMFAGTVGHCHGLDNGLLRVPAGIYSVMGAERRLQTYHIYK